MPRPWIIQVVLTIGLNKPIYNLHFRASLEEQLKSYYDCCLFQDHPVVAKMILEAERLANVNTYWQECGGGCWCMPVSTPGDGGGGRGGGSSCPVIRWTKQDDCLLFPRSEQWHRTTFRININGNRELNVVWVELCSVIVSLEFIIWSQERLN